MTFLEINAWCLAVFIVLVYLTPLKEHLRNRWILFVTFAGVLFFNVFKDWMHMADINWYVPTFKYICRDDATLERASFSYYKMQIGYFWLNKLISMFSTSQYWFLFAMGCIISLPYAYIIKKYSPMVWLSCLLYAMGFSQSTYVLRQHSAMGLTIMAFPLLLSLLELPRQDSAPAGHHVRIRRRRNWSVILKVLLILALFVMAMLIHPTAFIYALLIASVFIKSDKWFAVLLLTGTIVLIVELPVLTLMFTDNVAGYDVYAVSDNDNWGGTIITNGFLLAASLYALSPYKDLQQPWRVLLRIQWILFAFALVSMAPGGGVTIPRLTLYLSCFNCIFIPYVACKMPNTVCRVGFILVELFFAYYQFALSSRVNFGNYNIIDIL